MTLRIGSSGTAVRQLQQQLKAAGFDPHGVDGQFGAGTQAAVKAFQRAKHLTVDGLVGTQTLSALRDGFTPATTTATQPPRTSSGSAGNLSATFDRVSKTGQRDQMVEGRITVNGHTYNFRSGGHNRGNLPAGSYDVTAHMWNRNTPGMVVGGVGFSFALSDKYDSRVGGTRTQLRIHPDGGSAGTSGCIGIVGDASVQQRFREDMRAELNRHGGHFTLNVG